MFRIEIRPINNKNRKIKLVLNQCDLEMIISGIEFLNMFYGNKSYKQHYDESLHKLNSTNSKMIYIMF